MITQKGFWTPTYTKNCPKVDLGGGGAYIYIYMRAHSMTYLGLPFGHFLGLWALFLLVSDSERKNKK